MQLRAIMRHLWLRYRAIIWDGILLLALMAIATLIAYEYDIFPNSAGVPEQEHVIETDEALALATLLCLGLLALSWRFLKLQRREVARRVAAERRAHELAMQDALTGLPNRRRFDRELKDAVSAPPHSHGAHAVLLLDLNAFKRINDLYATASATKCWSTSACGCAARRARRTWWRASAATNSRFSRASCRVAKTRPISRYA
jgi:predicted signal transduction protein with EAL and GGDEF domain